MPAEAGTLCSDQVKFGKVSSNQVMRFAKEEETDISDGSECAVEGFDVNST